ncbi:O-antigen ligase family protein [uncultured Thermosynechococcus sp.]|uniref:O-antigen ligase family protein n=1 Tax=uncultured Thermosynechococcus sp. TaxID=436945 RepID=UPI002617EDC5|nr:O-antigen ligase family protein [uncultured Thermosynechococcus sp.]
MNFSSAIVKNITSLIFSYQIHFFLITALLLGGVRLILPYDYFVVAGLIALCILSYCLEILTRARYRLNLPLTSISRLLLGLFLFSVLFSILLTGELDLPRSSYRVLLFSVNMYLLFFHLISHVPDKRLNQFCLGIILFLTLLLILFASSAPFFTISYSRKFSFIPEGIYKILPPPRSIEDGGYNPNYFPALIVILLPTSLVWWLFPKTRELPKWLKWLTLVGVVTSSCTLILLQSRASFTAVVISILILLILRVPLSIKPLLKLIPVLLLILIFLFIYPESVQSILRAFGNPFGYSFIERNRMWLYGWLMLNDFMFTGSGIVEKSSIVHLFYPKLNVQEFALVYLHNVFLEIVADVGIFGLISWLSLWATTSVGAWFAYRSHHPLLSALGAALLATQWGIFIHQLFEGQTWVDFKSSSLVWLLWGVAMGIGFRAKCLQKPERSGSVAS